MTKNEFYYNIETHKGYIVGDKIRINREPFETGCWKDIIGEDIQNEYLKDIFGFKYNEEIKRLIFKKINENILKHKVFLQRDNKKIKNVYLNFNGDGIDCFIHRWNYKDNN